MLQRPAASVRAPWALAGWGGGLPLLGVSVALLSQTQGSAF